jgi:predicted nucleic-acid-binding Zn-ribbon protein
MKSGICPKCGSSKVNGNTGNTHGISVDAWAFPQLNTILLVCAECGYLEFYVEDEAKLAKLREKFGKVE